MEYLASTRTSYPAPNVPTYCFYGTGFDTAESFYYPQGFGKDPIITRGPGDGLVNDLSSEVCLKWQEAPGFVSREFEGVDHFADCCPGCCGGNSYSDLRTIQSCSLALLQ